MQKKYLSTSTINSKKIDFPIYLPDATYGVVRNMSALDVKNVNIKGVVINTYHLMTRPGADLLTKIGGIGKLMNWSGLMASDSGGFQLFSLINKNSDFGKVTDDGVVLYSGTSKQRKTLFTPEDSIRVQFAINSDIMICLDDFTPDKADKKRLDLSITRTTEWAKRCKAEFLRQLEKRGLSWENSESRPHLYGVVQGHRDFELRKKSAEELQAIGFDGYGFGGWPFLENGDFDYEISQFLSEIMPDDKPKFALGIGNPHNIVRLFQMGFQIFDCVLPTRDARHMRVYAFDEKFIQEEKDGITNIIQAENLLDSGKKTEQINSWFNYLYFAKSKFALDDAPIDASCDCFTCQNHSRAYLHHLFKVKDMLAYRLATIHNLRFYARMMEKLIAISAISSPKSS